MSRNAKVKTIGQKGRARGKNESQEYYTVAWGQFFTISKRIFQEMNLSLNFEIIYFFHHLL
jgi:hypothetical protein